MTSDTDLLLIAERLGHALERIEKIETDLDTQAMPIQASVTAQTSALAALEAALSGIKALSQHVLANDLGALSSRVEEAGKQTETALATLSADISKVSHDLAAKVENVRAERQVAALNIETTRNEFSTGLAALRAEIDATAKKFATPQSVNPRGEWIDGEVYSRLDMVSVSGSSYISTIDGNRTKPKSGAAGWMVVAKRGGGGGGNNIAPSDVGALVVTAATPAAAQAALGGPFLPTNLLGAPGGGARLNYAGYAAPTQVPPGRAVRPGLMAPAPTISVGPAFGASQISSGVFLPAGSSVTGAPLATTAYSLHRPGSWVQFFTFNGRGYYIIGGSGGESTLGPGVVSFWHDGARLEINGRINDLYAILVDGQLVSASSISAGAGSGISPVNTLIDFGARARRRIVIYGLFLGFAGVTIEPTATVEPLTLDDRPSVAWMTDSYGATSTPAYPWGIPLGASLLCGWERVTTSIGGGSGFLAGGSQGWTFGQRLSSIMSSSTDILVTLGGINDGTAGLEAAALSYFQAARAASATCILVAGGCWAPNGTSTSSSTTKLASIRAALGQVAGPWLFINNVAGTWESSAGHTGRAGNAPWQSGSGRVGAATGTGNGDVYVSTDGVHPTAAGAEYLASVLAEAIRAGLSRP